ncbi:flagellar hook-length control protein FliK [Motiliproteus sp. MSK22-1]|uniref:flagellar hook-length control protein FliK n=1 Tax=Motiliproteus sp. MSK22-1 TaxID=1897630 RepID=UPI0009785B91|nr:flagellar hook-length control protein FliK [Motiliproteus sp. MSK22-1]OMH30062.1 hypothetical protein BGP75_19215 [Motiliproteus sp. MSK22-1]
MIDQLNTASIQKLSAELASGRLESLLRIGQTQIARVLEVSPQVARPAQPLTGQTPQTVSQPSRSGNASSQSADGKTTTSGATPNLKTSSESTAPAAARATTQSTAGQSNTGTNSAATSQTASKNQAASQSQSPANYQATGQKAGSKIVPAGADNPAYQAKINAEKHLLQIQSPKLPPNSPTTNRNDATATQGNAGPTTSQPKPAATQANVTSNIENRVYRTKISIEGKVVEIIMPRPVKAGTEIMISRDANNRLTVNVPQQTNPSPQPTATASPQTQLSSQPSASSTQQAPSASQNIPPGRTAAHGSVNTALSPADRLVTSETLVRPGERALARVIQVTPESGARPVELPANTAHKPAPPLQPATYSPAQRAKQTSQTANAAVPQHTATNLSSSARQAPNTQYRITLDLQGRNVEVVAPRPIGIGTEVRVQQDSQGQVTLKIPTGSTQAVEKALREHMPLQQPPNQLLNLLTEPQNALQISKAQPLLQSLVQILLGRSIATPQQTDAQSVRQQLLNSGTQFESRIAKGDTTVFQQDQKGLLMKLQQNLTGADSKAIPQPLGQRITQMTQQAISRVLFNQVSSLAQQAQESGSEQVRQHLALDIPVLWQGRNENIHLRINSDDPRQNDEGEEPERRWKVQLRFEMPEMPPMGADLALEGGKISVLWFGSKETRELLEPHLDQLQQTLEGIGLEVDTLAIREQEPPKAELRPPRQRLIDVKT